MSNWKQRKAETNINEQLLENPELKPDLFKKEFKKYLSISKNNHIKEEDALNSLIYGINCKKVEKRKIYDMFIFQVDPNICIISLLNKTNNKIEKIYLNSLKGVTFDLKTENLKKTKLSLDNSVINFLINKVSIDLVFNDPNDLIKLLKGILYYHEGKLNPNEQIKGDGGDYLKNLWLKYDRDFNGELGQKI